MKQLTDVITPVLGQRGGRSPPIVRTVVEGERRSPGSSSFVAIVDPRAAKLVTGRHWVEDDGAARLEATEKGLVERRGDC